MDITMAEYNIPAGFPWHAALKIQRKAIDDAAFSDIVDAADVPYHNWSLHFIDENNMSRCRIPIDFEQMTEEGYVAIELSPEMTKKMAGRTMHIAIRNNMIVSNLSVEPEDTFYFIPNNIPE